MITPSKESYDQPIQLKSRDITLSTKVCLVKVMVSPVVMYGCESWIISFWTMVLEKILESPLECNEIQPVHPKDQSWVFIGRTDVEAETPSTWCEQLTHLKRLWCWERSKAGGEGYDRRWDGWMASPTQWTWVWVNSRGWWWTGRPGMPQSTGLQSQTQLSDWTELCTRTAELSSCNKDHMAHKV